VSVKHIGLVLDHLAAKPSVKLVALILADHADADGICWPSYRRLSDRSGLDVRTVRRHVKTLIEQGLITKLRTGTIVTLADGTRRRLTNHYRIETDALAALPSLLSTGSMRIEVEDDHLEEDKGDRSRWTPATTEPSKNHHSNRHAVGNEDNYRDPILLDAERARRMHPAGKKL
jgi:DNA-binding MarR family transcriptional regulator